MFILCFNFLIHQGEEAQLDNQDESSTFDLASTLFPSKRFKYDSSDTEDEEKDEVERPHSEESLWVHITEVCYWIKPLN